MSGQSPCGVEGHLAGEWRWHSALTPHIGTCDACEREQALVANVCEAAAQIAEVEGGVPTSEGGSIARWDACNNVAREIRKGEAVKRPKPKFRVGQVVSAGGEKYFRVSAVTLRSGENGRVTFYYREIWTEWPECELRPLTRREAGQERAK